MLLIYLKRGSVDHLLQFDKLHPTFRILVIQYKTMFLCHHALEIHIQIYNLVIQSPKACYEVKALQSPLLTDKSLARSSLL